MAAMAAGVAMPVLVQAASSTAETPHDGTTPLETSAGLDISINVPRFLFLQVGDGGRAGSSTVSQINFSVNATNVGTGQAVTGGSVTARVIGNVGNVRLKARTEGALMNSTAGTPDTISFSQISVTAGAIDGSSLEVLAHPPALADGLDSEDVELSAVGQIVRREALWTFTYSNADVVAPGVYGGTQTGRNGRVTYTATAP
jgi:hypothetical protein